MSTSRDGYAAFMNLVLVLLATFWAWETVRFGLETYASHLFSNTRVVHPLLVAALPLYILWPDWVSALGVAGAVGLLVAVVDRVFMAEPVHQLPIPRRRTGGLPPLPG